MSLNFSQLKLVPPKPQPTFSNADGSIDHGSGNDALAALSHSSTLNFNQLKLKSQGQDDNPDEPQDSTYKKISDSLGNFSEGVVKGAGSTLTGLGTLASKVLGTLPGKVGKFFQGGAQEGEDLQNTTFKADGTAQEIGKGAEQIGEFLIPGGEVEKLESVLAGGAKDITADALTKAGVNPKSAEWLSKLASFGTKLAVRAGEGGAIIGAQTGGKDAGAGAVLGAAGAGAGELIGQGIEKLAAPFKNSFNEAAAKSFADAGIKPPVSAVTNNKFLQGAESLSSKTVFGQKVLDLAGDAKTKIQSGIDDLVSKITPDKNLSDEELGNSIKSGLKDAQDKFKKAQGDIYDEFSKTYGKSDTYGKNTKEALATITEGQKNDLLKGPQSDLKSMLNKITHVDNPEIRAINDRITQAKNEKLGPSAIDALNKELSSKQVELEKPLTFDQIKATRTSVGEMIQRQPENTAYKRLYSALSSDLDSAVSTMDPENGGRALEELNKGYANGKNQLNGALAQSISQSGASNLGATIGKKNSAETFDSLKKWMTPEDFQEVSNSFLRNAFDGAKKSSGEFDVNKFEKILNGFDKNTVNSVLDSGQQKDLKTAVSALKNKQYLMDAFKAGGKIGAGSQTAPLENIAKSMLGAPQRAIAIGAALASGHIGTAMLLVASPAADYGYTKLFTSDFGRQLLTEGFTPEAAVKLKNLGVSTAEIIKIKDSLSDQSSN